MVYQTLKVVQKINAFLRISDRISTAGQPTESDFLAIKVSGYETVINLALLDSPGAIPHEAQILKELDVEYIHIPVEWDSPTLTNALAFFEVMNQHPHNRIFIHCAANKRVSVFVYLYRVLCLGEKAYEAQEALSQIWQPNPVWQAFIDKMMAEFYLRQAPLI